MVYASMAFRILGSIGLFLYGMTILSGGIQQTAGDRMQKVLRLMTGNRLTGVLTGMIVTAIIQSSSATTVMVVSFVSAGLLTLTQSIGVIMGANIGTTITAWIVSWMGFAVSPAALALPAIGIGMILYMTKWKYRNFGEVLLGFGFVFLGLDFLTNSVPTIDPDAFPWIESISGMGFLSVLIGTGLGLLVTLIAHSSAATTAIAMAMARNGVIQFDIAAAMILGANIGTTIDAALAAIGVNTAAKRAALVHILFNVIGTVWALIFFRPLISLVDLVTPGPLDGDGITAHLAMLHTVFNVTNTLFFFPFVNPFAQLVSFLIKDKSAELPAGEEAPYKLEYKSGTINDTPEWNVVRAEKEIRDMAGFTAIMYAEVRDAIYALPDATDKIAFVDRIIEKMAQKEAHADDIRDELTRFLIECTRHQQLSPHFDDRVTHLLRIVADLEEMTDDCLGICHLLERSAKKNLIFSLKEMDALQPYMSLVEHFLSFVQEHLGKPLTEEQSGKAHMMEEQIVSFRDSLRKMGRKRIEAGKDVKTELLFIDLVRSIEKLGDFCYNISESLTRDRAPIWW
ncbi:phosphate:sodium symporter [Spirochaetia bacterium]|nr:phosphate:sodium symporter [Spirochaetia bacterium]GHU29754.1 phosphate:sodium symporter [Spirochaetia bacterium]